MPPWPGIAAPKHDDVGERDEGLDELRGMTLLEQLGDLEAEREVEASRRGERPREVGDLELAGRHEELGAVDPRAVVAEDVRDAVLLEHGEPGAEPAPDIDDASRRDRVEDERYGNARRFRRAGEPALEVDRIEGRGHGPSLRRRKRTSGRLTPAPRSATMAPG